VCVIAFLSLAGVPIAPVTYAFAAVVMLPVNSALNPIIYSNVLSLIYGLVVDCGCSLFEHLFVLQDITNIEKNGWKLCIAFRRNYHIDIVLLFWVMCLAY